MGIMDKVFRKKKSDDDLFKDDDIFKEHSEPFPSRSAGMDHAFDSGIPEGREPKVTFSSGQDEMPDLEPSMKPRLQPTRLEQIAPNRDTELILSRLDAIKANIDNINIRLENIERNLKEKRTW